VTLLTGTKVLNLDAAAEVDRITAAIREMVFSKLRKKGAVIGVSGGIDSTVVAYICARALGSNRVVALFTPEVDSSPDSLKLGRMVSESLGVPSFLEDISPILRGARCYERRDEAIRTLIPDYGKGWGMKIILPSVFDVQRYALFSLVAQSPTGMIHKVRLTIDAYLNIVAATNFKQRTRKMMEYYYADRFNYAVAGTPNRLEYDLGFFVKNGDGAADFKPIAHLYKTQVYQLAEYLGVPEEIRMRPPTTDTYSLPQTQEEFYFSLSLERTDLCLYGYDHKIVPAELATIADLPEDQVRRMYDVIVSKRKVAEYLHANPMLVEPLSQ
jgi:NAD+ synthase